MPLSGSFGALLLRGLLAGFLAGLLAGAVGFVVGEPKVEAAIALEEAAAGGAGHDHGDAAEVGHSHNGDAVEVSRPWQKFGQFLAGALAGTAFGAIVATVAHYARRFTTLPLPILVSALGLGGWLAVVVVPYFKYPPNPPAVGDPETVDQRTLLWVATVALGLLAVAAGTYAWKLARRYALSLRFAGAVAAAVVVTALGYVLLPNVNEVGADFPATLLWEFRISSLAVSTTLWIALGLAFAALIDKTTRTPTGVAETTATTG